MNNQPYTLKAVLDNGAYLPDKAHDEDAGYDLRAREEITIQPGKSALFDTGVHIAFDKGTYGKIESKSGLHVKHDIVSLGGVLDSGYSGSITVKLYNFGDEPYTFLVGDKIAQVVIHSHLSPQFEIVDVLEPTERGDGAFGSSGR